MKLQIALQAVQLLLTERSIRIRFASCHSNIAEFILIQKALSYFKDYKFTFMNLA